MALQIEWFQRTNFPFIDELATNANWKNADLVDSLHKYWYYPIRRPENNDSVTFSMQKYIYAKISGTYPKATKFQVTITGLPLTNNVNLYYKETTDYIPPVATYDGGMTLAESDLILFPKLSDLSPELATSRIDELQPDTTYYSNYIKTQLLVRDDGYVGNTEQLTIKADIQEWVD